MEFLPDDSHHEQIEAIGPDTLARRPEVGREEQEREDESERNGAEDEPRPIGAPARLRTVRNRAHERVGDDIEHTGDEHQRRRIGERQAEHIREEEREGDGHNLPGDAAGSGITQSISDFFSERDHN